MSFVSSGAKPAPRESSWKHCSNVDAADRLYITVCRASLGERRPRLVEEVESVALGVFEDLVLGGCKFGVEDHGFKVVGGGCFVQVWFIWWKQPGGGRQQPANLSFSLT